MIKFFFITVSVLVLFYFPVYKYVNDSYGKQPARVLTSETIKENTLVSIDPQISTITPTINISTFTQTQLNSKKVSINKNKCNNSDQNEPNIDKNKAKAAEEPKPNVILFTKSINNTQVVAFSRNSWCFNQELIQYASVLSFDPQTELLHVETLVYFVYQKDQSHLVRVGKCVIIIDPTDVIIISQPEVSLMDSYAGNHLLFKVKCALSKEKHRGLFDKMFVGVIEDESKHPNLSERVVYVNKPSFFNLSAPKKKEIVNCVHTLRGLTPKVFAQMKTWLKINQKLGYSKIKLCAVDYNTTYMHEVKNEFGDFVEINNFELNLGKVCSNYKNASAYVCNSGESAYFGQASNFHEKVCTNECLINYRYEYEFLTNYDIDEIIFPRNFTTSFHRSVLEANKTSDCREVYQKHETFIDSECFKFNMYDYAMRLHKIYGQNVAFFEFTHFLMLSHYDQVMSAIETENSTIHGSENYIYYDNKKDARVKYMIRTEEEKKYFGLVKKLNNLTRCLNQTYLVENPVKLHYKWTNVIAAPFRNRAGKSLFNCNNTFSINQHSGNMLRTGTHMVRVEDRDGFLSHFRSTDTWSMGMNRESIFSLHFDIEYLFFLIRSFPI
jgi:hypothetical protein